jgi:hypothetical protein
VGETGEEEGVKSDVGLMEQKHEIQPERYVLAWIHLTGIGPHRGDPSFQMYDAQQNDHELPQGLPR